MVNKGNTFFTQESVYDAKIRPLVKQIKDLCEIYGIPMLASFAVKNSTDQNGKKVTEYKNTVVSPTGLGYNLYDDQIKEHEKILLGFKAEAPWKEPVLTGEDDMLFDDEEGQE